MIDSHSRVRLLRYAITPLASLVGFLVMTILNDCCD